MRGKRVRRGFALLMVVLLVAALAVAAVVLLDLVSLDFSLIGEQRQLMRARSLADGAMFEVLDSSALPERFPDFTTPGLSNRIDPPGCAPPCEPLDTESLLLADGGDYQGSVALLRYAPVPESSLGLVRAVMYEVSARSKIGADGAATSEVRTEIVRMVTKPNGTLLPRVHAR